MIRHILVLIVASSTIGAATKPSFEAATVKEGRRLLLTACSAGPGTLEYRCWSTVSGLAASALGLPLYAVPQESGQAYFVDAKIPKGSTQDDVNEMLLTLLVERFGFAYHFEKKEMNGYFLTLGSGGIRLKPTTEAPQEVQPLGFVKGMSDADRPAMRPGTIPGTFELRRTPGKDGEANLTGRAVTTKMLAKALSMYYDIVVVDNTDVAGRFSFHIVYKDPELPDDQWRTKAPDIWTAIQSDIGLKMTRKKGLVDILVIDHADRAPRYN